MDDIELYHSIMVNDSGDAIRKLFHRLETLWGRAADPIISLVVSQAVYHSNNDLRTVVESAIWDYENERVK